MSAVREQWRTLFDGVAGLCDTSRQGYPAELVDEVVGNAAAGPGATRTLRLPAETVLGVERTRAMFLSWPEPDQAAFTADLSALLDRADSIDVVQETFLATAPTRLR